MPPVRIAHGARGAEAPANTAAAVAQLLGRGAEGVEVDVSRDATGRLALGHGRRASARADGLDAVLAIVAGHEGPRPLVVLDLKAPGVGPELATAVGRYDVADAVLVTARQPRELRLLAGVEGGLRRGWSLRWPWHAALLGGRPDLRAPVREAVRRAVADGLSGAIMLHHSLVSPGVVGAVHEWAAPCTPGRSTTSAPTAGSRRRGSTGSSATGRRRSEDGHGLRAPAGQPARRREAQRGDHEARRDVEDEVVARDDDRQRDRRRPGEPERPGPARADARRERQPDREGEAPWRLGTAVSGLYSDVASRPSSARPALRMR